MCGACPWYRTRGRPHKRPEPPRDVPRRRARVERARNGASRVQGQTAEAYWLVEAGRGEIRRETLPPPGPGQAVVDTLHSGVSRGTELLVHHGRVPASERERMRAPHQAGDFPFPVKYGY